MHVFKLRDTIGGFYYISLYNKTGIPTAVMYMTAIMRYNLLRYGNIILIDSQKKQYNSSGLPYIDPVINNCENKLCVTAEDIITSEDINMYTLMFDIH